MTEVMRPSRTLTQVFLYRLPIDFRKSFNGLAAIVEQELGHNVFDGKLYAFTNKRRNKITKSRRFRRMPVLGAQWFCSLLQNAGGRKIQVAQTK